MAGKKKTREKSVPKEKIALVEEIAKLMIEKRTTLIVSTKGLPSAHFHAIKKNLRGRADIKMAKKSLVLRAIDLTKKQGLQGLKEHIQADIALFFSDLDAFELSSILSDNRSPARAKAGDIAPEDINVEPGPTDLLPGPAISELSSVGLKVAVENGKLAIKLPHTVAFAGEPIKENVASVLGKLNISPMVVGFEPLAAYSSKEEKVYKNIKVDKKKTLEELKMLIGKALGFAVNIKYMAKETLSFFFAKAASEEKAIQSLINKQSQQNV